MTNMLNGIKAKAILIGIMAVSILISGCGVKKDSDDRAMLVIGKTITEVNSDGKETLLDTHFGRYGQYDSGNNLLISSNYCSTVSIYNLDTGAKTDIGFPMIDGKVHGFDYEGQRMYGLNTWYEEGKVSIYASNTADHTLGVFTFDCETNELVDTASYDIQSAHFVRDAGNFLVYVKSVNGKDQTSQYGLEIYDKTTGENKTVARDIATLGSGFQLIVLNGDKSKVLFAKTKDEAHALYEYDIPTGEIREIYECKKGDIITGFTYALGSNKIYVRYGKKSDAIVGYVCRPNHTKVITTDGRKYDLHFSFIDGYDWNGTGIVIY